MLLVVFSLVVVGAAAAAMRSAVARIDRSSAALGRVRATDWTECAGHLDAASHRLAGAVEGDEHR